MTVCEFLQTNPTLSELYDKCSSYSFWNSKVIAQYIDKHDYDINDVFYFNREIIKYLEPKDYGKISTSIYLCCNKDQLLLNKKYIKPIDLAHLYDTEKTTILELLDTHNIDYVWEYLHLAPQEVVTKVIKYVEDNADRLFETSISKENTKSKDGE